MDRTYDIFEEFPNGSVEWHDAVTGLEAARARLDRLARRSHNEFYAKHLPSNEIVARQRTQPPQLVAEALYRQNPPNGAGSPGKLA